MATTLPAQSPARDARDPITQSRPTRLPAVDMLRGAVMIVMALDHTREYFTVALPPPENMATTWGALFFTRFLTHFCAPVFFFLAGTGVFLSAAKGKPMAEVSRFLWTRGLWLVLLEFTIAGFGWSFVVPFGFAGVLWALGWSMVVMSLIVRMPVRWITILATVMIAGHNLLDRINPASFGKYSWIWLVLHSPGGYPIKPPNITLFVAYPLIPWIGVMAAGYAFGTVLLRPDRRRITFLLGASLTGAFLLLRGFNLYGNSVSGLDFGFPLSAGPWSVQRTTVLTMVSFFNTLKYPPSLQFLLMTLGPALMCLAWFDRMVATSTEGVFARVLLVYGRVPMFYYLLHLYLVHIMAVMVALAFGQPTKWLLQGAVFFFRTPVGYGHHLPFIYFIWIVIVALLYLPCRWFMRIKQEHRDWWWLSYL